MSKQDQLSNKQRDFFALVDRAAFSNPFSEERLELDRQIAGAGPAVTGEEVVKRALGRVLFEVAELERAGRASLRHYRGEERRLLHSALLFDVFHRHADDFDALIRQQVAAGDTPCTVPFARGALELLARRGFADEEALRYFAFFFQMRRAFHFISSGLSGESPSMRGLRRHLWNNVFTSDISWYEEFLWNRMEDFSTLLLGETGTGKGAAAAAIGRSGYIPYDPQKGRFAESFTRNFIPLNLAQYPEALIESELFGHKKGAFTGAIDHHHGVLARCSPHGAIFLDEIGDVSIPVQIKLLQVLQERLFSPVGSHEKIRFQGRVIAATNRPLDELRRSGEFRDDFFYRLCSDTISVPSLRQRLREDPRELRVLLGRVVQRTIGREAPALVETIAGLLAGRPGADYPWPGNVRELEQAVRRVLITGGYVGESSPPAADRQGRLQRGVAEGKLTAQELQAAYCAHLYDRRGTYEEVARVTGLDRRTVKKYILAAREA